MASKVLVYLVAVFFLLYGVAFSLFPEFMLHLITGAEVSTSSAVIDLRSTYGGMSIALAATLFYVSVNTALRLVLILMTGMAVTRMIGIYIDGEPNFVIYLYLTLELIVIGLSLILIKRRT